MSTVLVINSGSSSFKYELYNLSENKVIATGLVERIGQPSGKIEHETDSGKIQLSAKFNNHTEGFAKMLEVFADSEADFSQHPPVAVGHRVVHGGDIFFEPTIITDEVQQEISELSLLAPLHNPGAVQGIIAAREAFPELQHVAVFDTAFHQTMPFESYTYAIDQELAAKHKIRRYGFHGTSHKYVSEQAAKFLSRPLEEVNSIVLHLGNGASACAVKGGKSINTTMGMTPLEGLVMGTRSGDIDPAVLVHLHRAAGMNIAEIDAELNKKSGLLGLTGSQDMRDVQERASAGDEQAIAGLSVYYQRIKMYIGAYFAQLGRLDAIVFTAGVGENSAPSRAGCLAGLAELGIELDSELNKSSSKAARRISTPNSKITVLVIPTDEEKEIATQTLAAISS